MLTSQTLAVHRDFGVYAVQCRNDHRDWSTEEMHDDYRIVLVRRGRFRRQADGVAAYVDRTLGYVGAPGQEERFSHPAGGDTCTAIRFDRRLWPSVAGASATAPEVLRVDTALDLAHRRLLLSAREPDVDFAVAERLVDLAASAAGRQTHMAPSSTDAALVAMACEAIGAAHPAAVGLIPLANLFGVSPYRLSRVFSSRMGISLTRHRNRVRAGRAVDAIEAGEVRLGALARQLGFADQAHLTRTVKQHYGHTPTALQELLRHASHPSEENNGET